MKVILLQDVPKVGKKDQVLEVKKKGMPAIFFSQKISCGSYPCQYERIAASRKNSC